MVPSLGLVGRDGSTRPDRTELDSAHQKLSGGVKDHG